MPRGASCGSWSEEFGRAWKVCGLLLERGPGRELGARGIAPSSASHREFSCFSHRFSSRYLSLPPSSICLFKKNTIEFCLAVVQRSLGKLAVALLRSLVSGSAARPGVGGEGSADGGALKKGVRKQVTPATCPAICHTDFYPSNFLFGVGGIILYQVDLAF